MRLPKITTQFSPATSLSVRLATMTVERIHKLVSEVEQNDLYKTETSNTNGYLSTANLQVAGYLIIVLSVVISCSTTSMGSSSSIAVSSPTLSEFQTKDRIIKEAASQARKIMEKFAASKVGKVVDFFVVDYNIAGAELLDKRYHTDSCKALIRGNERPVAICNVTILYEIEAAIRSFLQPKLSQTYFTSDDRLFALVQDIGEDPHAYLKRIRSHQPAGCTPEVMDKQIIQQMKLIMILFFGHELGHIKDGLSGRSFINMLPPDAPLEHRVTEAVVRLCRHAEEFDRLGFDLPGFSDVIDVNSNIRKVELGFRKRLSVAYENSLQWYKSEVLADEFANSLIIDYLASIERTSKIKALEEQHLFIGSLFFSSIYFWYKDLYQFTTKASDFPITNSMQLAVCMMRDRDQYIKAASLFGSVHRFLLLRSHLAIENVIEKRTDFFKLDPKKRTIWLTKEELEVLGDEEAMLKTWHFSNLQKYYALAILMDTPVKFAHVGAATGWIKEIDKKRGTPQLLMMNFEPINVVMQRLLRMP